MTEKIIVAPNRVFGLQEETIKRAHIAYEKQDVQFVDALEAFLKADYQQREKLIEEVLKRKSSTGTFVVGEVFQHRVKGLVPQYFGDNFKNWMWTPAKDKVISISAFGKNNLKEYVLPKSMNDSTIQSNANSTPMSEDQFWAMLYLLIINPKLGKKILKYELRKDKWYLFHVKLTSVKVVVVGVGWRCGEWSVSADDFDYGASGHGDNVFLSPVPA